MIMITWAYDGEQEIIVRECGVIHRCQCQCSHLPLMGIGSQLSYSSHEIRKDERINIFPAIVKSKSCYQTCYHGYQSLPQSKTNWVVYSQIEHDISIKRTQKIHLSLDLSSLPPCPSPSLENTKKNPGLTKWISLHASVFPLELCSSGTTHYPTKRSLIRGPNVVHKEPLLPS